MSAEQVKPGYKRTEVGVIPEDWQIDLIGNKTSRVGSRITPTGGEKVYKDGGRPFLRSQNVGWGNLMLDDIAFIDDETHGTFSATEIEADDVFLNITGASIGRSAVADSRVAGGNVNQHVCIIRTITSQLDPNFTNYFLLSNFGQRQIDSFQAGGNRQGLNFEQIRSFQLPIPPLLEQRAIATALSDVDTLLAQLDQLIAKKRDLKQATMQQLLTGQTRLPGFSGEWEVKRLGDFSRFLRNGTFSRAELEEQGGTHYLHYGDIHTSSSARLDAIAASTPYLSESKARTLDRLECGDLVFADASEDYNGVGKSVEISNIGSGLVSGLHTIPIRFQKSILSDGFKAYLQFIPSFRNHLLRLASGTKVYATQRSHIASAELKLPPVEEQTAIATVLSDMDAELAALEARRDKTRALKQGMMQELLTGRIRLV